MNPIEPKSSYRRTLVALAVVAGFFVLGYWIGYWHGRSYELYKSAQRYGVIPQTLTFEQFLERKPP